MRTNKYCIYKYNNCPIVAEITREIDNKVNIYIDARFNHRVADKLPYNKTLFLSKDYVRVYNRLYDAMEAQDGYLMLE